MTTPNKTDKAVGYTWTYVAQYRDSRAIYEGMHSWEEDRLWDGYGRTLASAKEAALNFTEIPDNSVQRLVSVCVRKLDPEIESVFDLPIVEIYGKHGARMKTRFGNRKDSRPNPRLRHALRKLHGKKTG